MFVIALLAAFYASEKEVSRYSANNTAKVGDYDE